MSAFVLMSPLSSTIVAPGLPIIVQGLSITIRAEQTMVISIFMLGFAFGPLIASPLSEIYGPCTGCADMEPDVPNLQYWLWRCELKDHSISSTIPVWSLWKRYTGSKFTSLHVLRDTHVYRSEAVRYVTSSLPMNEVKQ